MQAASRSHEKVMKTKMFAILDKIILQIVQKLTGGRNLLNTTLQCMRIADHVTLNFNNKMSTAAVFLDIEKAFDTMCSISCRN
jgi:hypothetical protein